MVSQPLAKHTPAAARGNIRAHKKLDNLDIDDSFCAESLAFARLRTGLKAYVQAWLRRPEANPLRPTPPHPSPPKATKPTPKRPMAWGSGPHPHGRSTCTSGLSRAGDGKIEFRWRAPLL